MFRVFKAKWILPANDKVVKDGLLVLENGKIVDIIQNIDIKKQSILNNASEITDYGDAVITPGFINLHAHLQYTDLKKNQKELNFPEWIKSLMLQYFLWGMKRKINSVINGAKEALLSGTTCITQLSGESEFLETFNKLDLKTYIFFETFANTEESSEIEFKKLIQKYDHIIQNKNENVFVGFSPHSVYTVHPYLWEKIAEFSSKNNILVHTHLAESIAEMEWLKNGHSEIDSLYKLIRWNPMTPYKKGLNPVEYLKEFNILNENLIAAHMIQLDKSLMQEIFSYGVKLAYCPRSNMLLHGKTIDVSEYKEYADSIGIGTDSKYSNYDLSILHEAKFIKFSSDLDLFQLLNMLTINAAKILKIDDRTGSLKKGRDADFLVFRLNENESYLNLFDKDKPDDVYIKGKHVVKAQKLVTDVFK
ncbi:MAG: amidohydrolase family protein [Candidatus Gastranaerophilales bacterium]|nr:amidohydrolase family protein [Candidatus Gastranaerophilales bacterium]